MSLLEKANSLPTGAAKNGGSQTIKKLTIDMAQLPAFAEQIEAAFPKATLNTNAIEKNGHAPHDETVKMTPYAIKTEKPNPTGSCTVWYSGTVVLAGAMADFEFKPKPAAKPRRAEAAPTA